MVELENILKTGGDLIETGALMNNYSIAMMVIGGAFTGISCGIGVGGGNKNLLIAGSAIGGAICLAGLIINIIGNKKMSDGGTILKGVNLTGNGISIPLSGKKQNQYSHIVFEQQNITKNSEKQQEIHNPDDYSEYYCYQKYISSDKYYIKVYTDKKTAIRTIAVSSDVYYKIKEGQLILKSDIQPYLKK